MYGKSILKFGVYYDSCNEYTQKKYPGISREV